MTTILESSERVTEVRIEGLALLKIIKHCQDSLPQMVTGTLLGLQKESILEITYCFPDVSDDDEYSAEMMRMLREVNYDNNCVGWYQSMYLGIFSTTSLLENQLNYQSDLSENAVVILYDPMQTTHGNLVLKCFRLTDTAVKYKQSNSNGFLKSTEIFEPVPVKLVNPSLAQALLCDVRHNDTFAPSPTFDALDLSTNPYLEKHLEFLCHWVDDLADQQQKFQYYSRQQKSKHADWNGPDAPRRLESLLISNQIKSYCDQMQGFTKSSLSKLYLVDGLHKSSVDAKKQK